MRIPSLRGVCDKHHCCSRGLRPDPQRCRDVGFVACGDLLAAEELQSAMIKLIRLNNPPRYLSLGRVARSLPAHLGRKVLARMHVTNFWKVAAKSNVRMRSTSSAPDLTNVEVSPRNT